ncbi:energy transducer TonB [Hydrogenophaga sp. MI9]|uniref:energy transducer TonB n=1 Tax=Hydrogenophaga sp. MI9 TaxID=3453719 RepID=UPI003EEF3B90
MDRRLLIVATVIGLHVAGLWALQAGLLQRAVELVVPVSVVADLIEPPQPQVTPEPTPPRPVPTPAKPLAPAPRVAQAPAPMPLAVADPKPAPQAPTGMVTQEPLNATAPAADAPTPKPSTPSSQAPSRLEDEFVVPAKPAYPRYSLTLGESGSVTLSIRIEANGTASDVVVLKSSGFPRLDEAAVKKALHWKYVPRDGGSPQPGSYLHTVRFEIY